LAGEHQEDAPSDNPSRGVDPEQRGGGSGARSLDAEAQHTSTNPSGARMMTEIGGVEAGDRQRPESAAG